MATSRRGGSDRVLESRHLVGLFLGVVLLCAVFFTLGYVMGKTQYGVPGSAADASAADDGDAPPVHNRTAAHSAKTAPGTPANSNANADGPTNREWDFYASDKKQDKLDPPSADPAVNNSATDETQPNRAEPDVHSNVSRGASKNVSVVTDRRGKMPWISKGAIVLQLAALTREGDALAMADALQQKGFPSFVVTPTNDAFYRVQVGPYKDTVAAEKAKQSLDREGFRAIVKR